MELQKLQQIDGFLGRHYPLFVLSFVAVGLLFPDVFSPLNSICIPLFAFITFANSLGGGFGDLARVFAHPLPVLAVMGVLHVAMPLAALGLGTLLFPESPLFTTGLVLEYAIPTAVVSLMWTGMAGGNIPLCLSILLLDTLLSPLIIPLTMRLLCGSVVALDSWGMMRDLLFMVALPALAAMTIYRLTRGRCAVTWKPRLSPIAKIGLLLVIMANATGCAPFLRNLNGTLGLVILAVFVLCLLGFFLGYWIARWLWFPFPTVLSMSISSGARNISAGAVLAAQYFPPDVLFPVAFSPVFLQLTISLVVKVLLATKPGKAWREQEARSVSPSGS